MAILTLSGIGQSYGGFDVFSGVTGSIPNDGKVGLVGPNGIGKTTLLRILAGQEEPNGGSLHFARGTQMGYLRQEAVMAFAQVENSVWEEMLTVFAPVRKMEQRLHEIEELMATGEPSEEEYDEYSKLQAQFESSGGYDYELRIKQTLSGLGFGKDHYDSPLSILSGGQKTRALLARLLLEKPDLLILDEPTNHLDLQAVEWLEATLKAWEGAILIVSHDRYFLDRVANNIWEMSRSGIETYRGNYSHYVQQREERWALRSAEFDALQDRFLKELDYVKRNIARDSTKNMAVGRLKRLIREVKMVQVGGADAVLKMQWAKARDQFEISSSKWEVPDVEQAIKALPRPVNRMHVMNIDLKAANRSGNLVLRTRDLEGGYPGTSLFHCEDIELHRLEVAALIGGNGAGKTTFLRTILGKIDPLSGEVILGASLSVGYFAQAHDELNPEKTVLDELMDTSGMLIPAARNYLGRYLFRGEDVYKPISLLSGGERGRLALAILALNDANLLLLDEPTNHLDIPSQEALEVVLRGYDGTILMVSHDRYLVDKLATQVWEIRDGELRVYEEGYAGYLSQRGREKEQRKVARAEAKSAAKAVAAAPATNGQHEKAAPVSKLSKNELRKMKQQLTKLEKYIALAESELERCAKALEEASAEGDFGRIQAATEVYYTAETNLSTLMQQWEQLSVDLES